MKGNGHVHLTAVCGMGMGAFAGLLKESGYRVTGSDQNVYPPMSTQLENMGIKILKGYQPENLASMPDLVIIGNTVKKDNIEVTHIMESGLKYMSFPQALRELFLKGKKSLVVAGTHGKTTTSSMVAWMLEKAGNDPGFLIGGILENFNNSYKLGKGEYFVVEGDEYDTAFFDKVPKFLHYQPYSAIVTSIEFDHGDIYRDIEHIKSAFTDFIKLIPSDGVLLACGEYANVRDIIPSARCKVETYGFSEMCDWKARILYMNGETNEFNVTFKGQDIGTFKIMLPGKHNILNALGAIALLYRQGIEAKDLYEALITFKGVKRRQEIRAVIDGVIVIDDFAHHPTKVRETVSAIRTRYPDKQVWAIFEPRTNTSRRAFFQKEYATSFADADKIIVAEVFNQGQINPDERFSPKDLVDDLKNQGQEAYYIPDTDQIVDYVTSSVVGKDVILIMSNGGFDSIHEKFVKSLNNVLS